MSLTHHYLNAKEQYFRERTEGDIDLIEEVRQALLQAGVGTRLAETFDRDASIVNATRRNPAVQRFVLNRYWTVQLYSTPYNTEDLRRLLFPEGDIGQWLDAFKTKILPFIIKNNLPVVV